MLLLSAFCDPSHLRGNWDIHTHLHLVQLISRPNQPQLTTPSGPPLPRSSPPHPTPRTPHPHPTPPHTPTPLSPQYNNKGNGQLTLRLNSHDYPQLAAAMAIPALKALWDSLTARGGQFD